MRILRFQIILTILIFINSLLEAYDPNFILFYSIAFWLCSMFHFYQCLQQKTTRYSILTFITAGVSTAYFTGLIIALISEAFSTNIFVRSMSFFDITLEDVFRTTTYISFVLCLLAAMGRHLPPAWISPNLDAIRNTFEKKRRLILVLCCLLIIIQYILINKGIIIFQGVYLINPSGQNNPLLNLSEITMPVITFLIGYYLLNNRGPAERLFLLLLLLMELGVFFMYGRRSILFFFFLAFLGATLNIERIRMSFRLFISSVALLIVSITLANLFNVIRLSGSVHYSSQGLDLNTVDKMMRNLGIKDENRLSRQNELNLKLRPASVPFSTMKAQKAVAENPVLGGLAIGSALALSTPSDYLVDKKSIVSKEKLYNQEFNCLYCKVQDAGENFILESLLDFGLGGFLIYLALFVIICALANYLIRYIPEISVILWPILLINIFRVSTESPAVQFLSGVRDALVLGFGLIFIFKLFWYLAHYRQRKIYRITRPSEAL